MAKASKTPVWVKRLRQFVKASHGQGWILREHRGGRTQISRAYPDGSRSSITVGIQWVPKEAEALMAMVSRLDAYLSKGESLARAAELSRIEDHGEDTVTQIRQRRVDWPDVVRQFEGYIVQAGRISQSTWKLRYRLHMTEFLELMSEPGAPRNGNDVLVKMRDRFAHRCPPGSTGRGHRYSHIRDLLEYAHEECGAPERWVPTIKKAKIVGTKGTTKQAPTAISDIDGLRVYHSLEDPRWKLCFGLLLVFGLRPVELHHCRAEGGVLKVKGIKRNLKASSKERTVCALDPEGGEGMGFDLLAVLAERGKDALPPERVGTLATRLGVVLAKNPIWAELKAQVNEAGERPLVPYSCRDGYAKRGALRYRLPAQVMAPLMGHSVQTHLLHYQSHLQPDELQRFVAEAVARVNAQQPGQPGLVQ